MCTPSFRLLMVHPGYLRRLRLGLRSNNFIRRGFILSWMVRTRSRLRVSWNSASLKPGAVTLIVSGVSDENPFIETWRRGLRAVSDLSGLRRRLIVYPKGPVLRTQDGIEVVPFEHFCQMLASDALWV